MDLLGRIGAKQVGVSRTEVGPINAIAATVLGIDHYQPNLIINHGTAGAHNPELRLWDIVVGERTVDYGAYTSDHADAGSGINPVGWKPDPHRLRLDGRERTPFYTFSGDARAIETATAIKNPRGRVFRGTIGVKALHSKKFVTDVWNSSFSISPFATKAGMNAVSRNCLSGLARVREPARRAFRRHGNRDTSGTARSRRDS